MPGPLTTEPHAQVREPGSSLHPIGPMLIPIDLAPGWERVLGRAALLPLAEGARMMLLHVLPGSLSGSARPRAAREAQSALEEAAARLNAKLGRRVRVERLVGVGTPAAEIAAFAEAGGFDLLVMGRGAGRLLRDAFLGSTAERVLRGTRLPVLVVRHRPRGRYRRPAVALDLDTAALAAVRMLVRVAQPSRQRITAVHALETPFFGLMNLSEDRLREHRRQHREAESQRIAALLATAVGPAPSDQPPRWRLHVRFGPARTVIERAARRSGFDLLALGTRARSGAGLAFLGTVAGDVLRNVPCDVLVVPSPPA